MDRNGYIPTTTAATTTKTTTTERTFRYGYDHKQGKRYPGRLQFQLELSAKDQAFLAGLHQEHQRAIQETALCLQSTPPISTTQRTNSCKVLQPYRTGTNTTIYLEEETASSPYRKKHLTINNAPILQQHNKILWVVFFSEVLIEKNVFGVCHDCRFDESTMGKEVKSVLFGQFQRQREFSGIIFLPLCLG